MGEHRNREREHDGEHRRPRFHQAGIGVGTYAGYV